MPVKRKRGRLPKQESNKIRTRLIEISLKVEDCIYQKIPITMMEAESFIKEVTSYKLECSKDERSLQVIEKLIRCMKAIIIEHQESRTNDCDLYEDVPRVDSGAASPVYSLPDEDRTHMTQELLEPSSITLFDESPTVDNNIMRDIEEIDSIADNGNKVNAIHHCDAIDDITMMAAETTEWVAKLKTTIDVDIQKALSSLSLENVDEEDTTFPDIECSQSILNDFHEFDKLQQNRKSHVETTDTEVIDNTLKTNVQNNSQFQTIHSLANKSIPARGIVKAIIMPSSNVPTGDLTQRLPKPLPINNASRTIPATIVPSSHLTTVDLTKTSIKPLDINDTNSTTKALIVPSSHVNMATLTKTSTNPLTINNNRTMNFTFLPTTKINMVNLTKTSTKPLTINDDHRTTKATIVPSSNVNTDLTRTSTKPLTVKYDVSRTIKATNAPFLNENTDLSRTSANPLATNVGSRTTKTTNVPFSKVNTIDLTKTPTKVLNINDSSRTIKTTIVPSSKVNTEYLNKKSNKRMLITDTNGKVTIMPFSNIMTNEKLNKNPPPLNVQNQTNSFNSKTTTQNVAQHFGNTIPANTIYTHPNNNNFSSTNKNTINSYGQYNVAGTYNKNSNIINKVQDNIASKNASVKKKRGPRKTKVIKKSDNLAEKRSSDEITNKLIKKTRRPRSKKVNTEINIILKDSNVPIYNNFIENDLSWLENIRFVREIRDDEIDSKLSYLSENFWDNYDLPPNFDENFI